MIQATPKKKLSQEEEQRLAVVVWPTLRRQLELLMPGPAVESKLKELQKDPERVSGLTIPQLRKLI